MKVSVIVPVYNCAQYLDRCITSLMNQKLSDFEVLLIDDGSTDNSGSMIDDFAKKFSNVRTFHKQNGGVASARNVGLLNASGDFITFVDSDDYVSSEYLSTMYYCYEKSNADLVVSNIQIGNDCTTKEKTGIYTKIETMRKLYTRKSFMGYLVNKFFKRSIITEKKISFDERSHFCEDLLFCTEYCLNIHKSFYIDKILYHYCLNEGSVTKSAFTEKRFSVLETYKKILSLTAELNDPEVYKRANANYYIHCIILKQLLYKGNLSNSAWMNQINKELTLRKKFFLCRYTPWKERVRFLRTVVRI